MNHLDPRRQHLIDPVLNDRVRLPSANLHDLPGLRSNGRDLARHTLRDFAIPEFGQVLHQKVSSTTTSFESFFNNRKLRAPSLDFETCERRT
jgi:hypothetical protein